jgi:DNA-binding response OmpR family regulator
MTVNKAASSGAIRLLLVDDEEGFVVVLSKRLRKRGIDVTAVLSGDEAVKQFRNQEFDIVLLDLKMEFMDGIEVLNVLKSMKPELPVIMITGHGSKEDVQMGLDYGAVECLPKPYDFQYLFEKIRTLAIKE